MLRNLSVDIPRSRRGAAHVLIAAMLVPFIVTAALLVDFSYMQLIRTELRTATDAAAKAGAEALVRTQNATAAKTAAVNYAALNKVGGQTFQISPSDVILGRVSDQADGSWLFTANATPYNSVRVNGKIGNGGTTAAIPTFFAPALGHAPFSTKSQATAAQQEVEICLCIDRSGSMMFDMTGTDWSYAASNPLLYSASYYPAGIWRDYCSPPHPTGSRWAAVRTAVDVFLAEASNYEYPPRTALVTWSNVMTLPYFPNTSFPVSSTDIALPSTVGFSWSTNKTNIQTSLTNRSNQPVAGGTNMSAGIDLARNVLTGTNARPLSNKIMILLTDGQWNDGRDPVLAAQDAANAGITIHCVSMLTSTQATLTQVAETTGGAYYVTTNATQLQQAFRDIAKSLPIVLTD